MSILQSQPTKFSLPFLELELGLNTGSNPNQLNPGGTTCHDQPGIAVTNRECWLIVRHDGTVQGWVLHRSFHEPQLGSAGAHRDGDLRHVAYFQAQIDPRVASPETHRLVRRPARIGAQQWE